MNRRRTIPPDLARAVRVLATDYDGTLAAGGSVAAATWAAVDRWRASGRRVVLVTGREYAELRTVCPDLSRFDRVVAENGGYLADPRAGTGRTLAEPPPAGFVAALRARGVGPIAVGRVVVATWEPHGAAVEGVIREQGLPLRVIRNKRALMILPGGVDKASGLRAALDELGERPEGVVGVGDAENDEPLLAASALGVAVANALPALRAAAGWVTLAERGEGVAELIAALLAASGGE